MQEIDKNETLKQEWACKPRTNDQMQNGGGKKGCDLFVDDLFEEAQKVGAVCKEQPQIKNRVDTTIKLWKNGFTVNDGELRSYTDVANQCFLDSVKKGATPRIICKGKRDVEEMEKIKPTVVLNHSEPITNIQIWLTDGTRIVQKFNISHRISHVRDFITNYQGHQGRNPFMLTTSLPFRELLNESLTLEEANLKNAVVVQRLKKNSEPFLNLS